jgi:hypothetical protein
MYKSAILFFALLLSVFILSAQAQTNDGSAHPRLLVNAAQIAQVRKDIKDTAGWKYRSWLLLKQEADRYLTEPLEIPRRGGNWEQYYIGPSGYGLTRGEQIDDWRWEHIDTVSGAILTGDSAHIKKDYDGVVIAAIHNRWAIGALQLGLAYQISQNKEYARKAKAILMAYADLYPTLPARNKLNDTSHQGTGTGKIHVQNVNEAVWLLDMAQAADLVWDVLSKKDRAKLTEQLFDPGIALLTVNQAGWNIQSWQNAAIGSVGFLTGNWAMIDRAMNDTLYGYTAQVHKDVDAQGFWAEPTLHYHFFALEAMIQLAIAARNNGYPVDIQPLEKMFSGPIDLVNSYYMYPAINNSNTINLAGMEYYLYEWAYSEFGDPKDVSIIDWAHRRGHFDNIGPHFTGWALLFGKLTLAYPKEAFSFNKLFPGIGIGKLSVGTATTGLVCYLKYNTKFGSHVHPDNLSFDITKGREPIAVMSGNPNYISPLNGRWYLHTISSNSFLINETPQTRSLGKCLSYGQERGVHYMIAASTGAYDSTRFVRTLAALSPDLVFVFDQVKMDRAPQGLDIGIHPVGTWMETPPGTFCKTFKAQGYKLIKDSMMTAELPGEVYLGTRTPSGRQIMVSAKQDAPMSVIYGYGQKLGKTNIPIALFRRKTNQAVMAWCIAANGEKIRVELDTLMGADNQPIPLYKAAEVELTEPNGKKWRILVNPEKLLVPGHSEWNGKDFILL